MPEVQLRLDDVDPILRKRFYSEMIAQGARVIDDDTISAIINTMSDSDEIGSRVAALLPAAGHREPFKLQLSGPGGHGTFSRLVIAGEEAEIVASWLATNAGLQ